MERKRGPVLDNCYVELIRVRSRVLKKKSAIFLMSLVIDLSYSIFYRFYALRSYRKISKRTDFELNVDDGMFKSLFKKAFVDMIIKLSRKHKPDELLFAVDCMRCEIWRRNIMPEYKNRANLSDFDVRVFQLTMGEIIPELVEQMKEFKISRRPHPVLVKIVKHEGCEADDLVYIYCKHFRPDCSKVIITGDNDYLQLLDDKTEIFCLKGKSLRSKSSGCKEKDVLNKVLGGDPSDNIPRLLSKNALSKLFQSKTITEIFEHYENDERFQRNMQMVDMRQIPQSLVQSVVDKLES